MGQVSDGEDSSTGSSLLRDSRTDKRDLALGSTWTAIQNMLLAATTEGLGSCIYTFYDTNEEEKLKEILKVPERYRMAAIIQLGYSRIDPPSPSRKKLEDIVSHQYFHQEP